MAVTGCYNPRRMSPRHTQECIMYSNDKPSRGISRRDTLRLTAAAATGLLTGTAVAAESPVAKNGRIKQSICHWCFRETWTVEQLAAVAKQLGCLSVELVEAKYWPM